MNPDVVGKTIAKLRKESGYTQATLAEALGISDKAVSKWERGIACPDISLLPKLSILLDTDVESVLSGVAAARSQHWKGVLILDELACAMVYSKPLVYFLLSNFLLVGIREITIIGGDAERLLGTGEQWGIKLSYLNSLNAANDNLMIIYQNNLIYGAHLTRKYQEIMTRKSGASIVKTWDGRDAGILFITADLHIESDISDVLKRTDMTVKRLVRGTVCLPMGKTEEIYTAAGFVRMIENYSDEKIGDLEEIARNRGLKY